MKDSSCLKELAAVNEMIDQSGLYLVPESDYEKLGDVAADAFEAYPLHDWFAGGNYDPLASKWITIASLKSMRGRCVIYADNKDCNGFSVWMPSQLAGTKALPFILNGGFRLLRHYGTSMIRKLSIYESFAMRLKKQLTENEGWYLYHLTVAQKAQGQGIASMLMKPMLSFCDRTKQICYLETNKRVNVPLYQHFHFEVSKQLPVPQSEVMQYAMIRMPVISHA